MTETPNILKLIEASQREEAIALLMTPITISAAIGPRSAAAALEAAIRLLNGDVAQTARWMSEHSTYLGASPCERAERSDEDLQAVLKVIWGLEAGDCWWVAGEWWPVGVYRMGI